MPHALAEGSGFFAVHCAGCHGDHARGTEQGPPLVHPVYRRTHHADLSFRLAVERGVRAHHWSFGDMPPVPAVSPEQVGDITAYVRWLQEEAGIDR